MFVVGRCRSFVFGVSGFFVAEPGTTTRSRAYVSPKKVLRWVGETLKSSFFVRQNSSRWEYAPLLSPPLPAIFFGAPQVPCIGTQEPP